MAPDISRFFFPILVLLGGCCFGPQNSIIKNAYGAGFATGEIVLAEYFFGFLILFFLSIGWSLLFRRKKGHVRPSKKTLLCLAGSGAMSGLVGILYTFSLQFIPAYLGVIILFQFTWVGVVIQAVADRRLPDRRTVISVILLLAGTVIASGIIGQSVEFHPLGCLLAFIAGVCYAFNMFFLGKTGNDMAPLYRSCVLVLVSLVLVTVVFGPQMASAGRIPYEIWMYGLYLGGIGCALPAILFAIGMPKVSVDKAAILCSSELPASIFCAMLILGEGVSLLQWAGIALIFTGIALPHLAGAKQKAAAV
ncbi:MAG TPA: DMT family transporter [Methanocorpusculum sp.]|nr:DMT family transporter [Methanocorpusculum sp.]